MRISSKLRGINMKILWACGYNVFSDEQNQLIEILTANGHDIEVVEKYQKRHVVKELNATKDYDVLVVSELLEKQPIDIEVLESIKDNFDKLKIVFILSDEHIGDEYANNLIAIGMSNVLYMKHVSANNIYDLINNERGRPEAKQYLNIAGSVTGTIKETIDVTAEQIHSILLHIDNEPSTEGKNQIYERIEKDFNEPENLYILSYFPEPLIKELQSHPTVALFIENKSKEEASLADAEANSPNKIFGFGKGRPHEVKVVEKTVVKREEVIVEKIVNKGFKKLILTIWDNAEFGCELAYMTAKLTGLKVLVIDADLLAPKADSLLNVERTPKSIASDGLFTGTGLNIVLDSINRHTYRTDIFFAACVGRSEVKNLHVLTGNYEINNYEYYTKESYLELLEKAYQNFDFTIVLVNKSMYDMFTIMSLLRSDYNIIPVEANLLNLREYNSYFDFLEKNQKLQLEKNKYVAFEYRSGLNLDKNVIKSLIGSNLLGYISYDPKRIHYRNLKPCYAKRMPEAIVNEYMDILSNFDVTRKRTFKDKVKAYLQKYKLFIRSIKKKAKKKVKKKGRE